MDLLEGMETRRSIRAFKPDAVPANILEKILHAAGKSPSYMNTQPWEVAVVSGSKANDLRRILYNLAASDSPVKPDIPSPVTWPASHEKRVREHGTRRLAILGVERDDEDKRRDLRLQNFNFYGAPCAIFILVDASLSTWSIFDAGMYAQSIALAAHSFGIGACLQASVTGYPDHIRKFLDIPDTKRLILGIAAGYPDINAKINTYRSARMEFAEYVRWYI